MLRMFVFFFLSPFLEKALPLPGGTDKCAAVGMLEDEAMLSIYNVLRVPDTHVRDCSMLSRRCTKLLKMKWADLMCRPAWKVIWRECVCV